jgi:hypothetical protein
MAMGLAGAAPRRWLPPSSERTPLKRKRRVMRRRRSGSRSTL